MTDCAATNTFRSFREDEDLLEDVQVENRQAIEMGDDLQRDHRWYQRADVQCYQQPSEQYDEVSDFHYTCYGCADDYIRFVRNECRYGWYAFWFYENGIWHYMRSDISAVSVYFMDPLEKTHAVVFYSVLIFCLQKSSVKPDDNDRGGVKAWH